MTDHELRKRLTAMLARIQRQLDLLGPERLDQDIAHLDWPIGSVLTDEIECDSLGSLVADAHLRSNRAERVILSTFGTVTELCDRTPLDLLMLRGVGSISVLRIEAALAQRGLALRGTVAP